MVEVTPEAHEEILKLLEQENISADEATLRVVLCAGWGGFSFDLALDEPKDNDHKVEKDGYTIVVAPQVAQMAGKLTIEQHRWGGVYVRAENGGW